MAFYDLSRQERQQLTEKIRLELQEELASEKKDITRLYFNDDDTYIRKVAYIAIGRLYFAGTPMVQQAVVLLLYTLLPDESAKVRQTVINAAGEIGKKHFGTVASFFDRGLLDTHHSVRNAVIGSVKKMGQVNPAPVLSWAQAYLHHEDKEIRREICHGIELRGRTHPEDILPILQQLQYDKTARVKNTLVHVIGQIAYKKGCLETVVHHLKTWENQQLVAKALLEIVDVHWRYRNFSFYTREEARIYINQHFRNQV